MVSKGGPKRVQKPGFWGPETQNPGVPGSKNPDFDQISEPPSKSRPKTPISRYRPFSVVQKWTTFWRFWKSESKSAFFCSKISRFWKSTCSTWKKGVKNGAPKMVCKKGVKKGVLFRTPFFAPFDGFPWFWVKCPTRDAKKPTFWRFWPFLKKGSKKWPFLGYLCKKRWVIPLLKFH